MHLDPGVVLDNWGLFARGLGVTLVVAGIALTFAAALSVPLALMGLSRNPVLRATASVYLEAFRNLPFIVVVYVIFYGLPTLDVHLSEPVIGILALGFFAGAYLSEIVRGAILAVPPGQMDAARAIGMSWSRSMWEIVAPQTVRFILPPGTSVCISMLKETAVLSVITVPELTYDGLIVQGNTFAPFEVFIATAVLYWTVTALFASAMSRVERGIDVRRGGGRRASLADGFLRIDV